MAIAITGSSKGIGAAIATAFVRQGMRVALHYGHDVDAAVATREALEAIHPGSVLSVTEADLATSEGAMTLAEAWRELPEPLEGLVLNAGPIAFADWQTQDPAAIAGLIQSNLLSSWTLLQQLLPQLRTASATITMLGQNRITELGPVPRWTAYNAAKAGLVVLARTVAETEGPYGIRCNVVSPGIIDNGHYSPGYLDRVVTAIPLGRVGLPDDIAGVVTWLHSEAARYVTGSVIDVNGGYAS